MTVTVTVTVTALTSMPIRRVMEMSMPRCYSNTRHTSCIRDRDRDRDRDCDRDRADRNVYAEVMGMSMPTASTLLVHSKFLLSALLMAGSLRVCTKVYAYVHVCGGPNRMP